MGVLTSSGGVDLTLLETLLGLVPLAWIFCFAVFQACCSQARRRPAEKASPGPLDMVRFDASEHAFRLCLLRGGCCHWACVCSGYPIFTLLT